MITEISLRKTNTVWCHLYVKSKKKQTKNPNIKQKKAHRNEEETDGDQRKGWGSM